MKKKLVLSGLLVLAAIVFYFSKPDAKENSVESVSGTHPDKFYIGFIDMGRQRDFSFLSELNFNLWHTLLPNAVSGGKSVPSGWVQFGAPGDTLFSPLENYQTQVETILSANISHNYKSFSSRPKLEMLTFAQRSDYELEYVKPLTQDTVEWWYAFDTSDYSSGYDMRDSGAMVKHLTPGLNPGYIGKKIRAHMEQVGVGSPNELYCDTNYSWYIKPRMRINSGFANNPANINKKVCRIVVTNYDGDTVRNVDIKVSDFFDEHNFYNGSYKDEFRFPNNINQLLIDKGRVLNPKQRYRADSCKFDIQVYWYAECELWIDYVRVENNLAADLFNHVYDNTWIKWEADEIATLDNTYNFYTDESEYNFMPAIQYLNEEIHKYKPTLSINSLINITYNTPFLIMRYYNHYGNYSPACPLPPPKIKSNINRWGMSIVMLEDYPLYSTGHSWDFFRLWQTLPNTLPILGYKVADGVLGIPVSPSVYEDNLDSIINKLYLPDLKIAKYVAVEIKKPVHLLMQSFLSYGGTETGYAWREPTNQELNLMANLALTYNVKAISHFIYSSWGEMKDKGDYTRGAIGIGTAMINQFNPIKRDYNAYHQNKWEALSSLNAHISRLGDYLVTFDESLSNSYNYRNEKNQLTSNTFIKGVKTYIPAVGVSETDTSIAALTADGQSGTILQAAVFDVSSPDPHVKYFMLVNKRCSPSVGITTTDKIGGRRIVTINLSGLPDFNNWKLYDLENNTLVKTFDKNGKEINLGNFQPGEGKLYKLIAVI